MSDDDDAASYEDWKSAVDDEPTQCPFSGVKDSPSAILDRLRDVYGIDCGEVLRRRGGSNTEYDAVRLVNFLRQANAPDAALEAVMDRAAPLWSDDALLRAVLPGDPLIGAVMQLADFDDASDGDMPGMDSIEDGAGSGAPAAVPAAPPAPPSTSSLEAENAHLKATVAQLKAQLASASVTIRGFTADDDDEATPAQAPPEGDGYFESYSTLDIHEEMLKDRVRTLAYRDAIVGNPHLFEGKVVLDVGCGTGILSMFAASAGAKMVIGVDASGLLPHARKVVEENGLGDRVTLLQGRIEDLELPVPQVDIIISEWMGYFLLYESMFDSVLFARDKWLAPGGMLFPDIARLYVAPVDNTWEAGKREFWDSVYGYRMTTLKPLLFGPEPEVRVVDPGTVCGDAVVLQTFNLETITKADLAFRAPFEVHVDRTEFVGGLVTHFDVDFSHCHKLVRLPTGPKDVYTHWKQTAFRLWDSAPVPAGGAVRGVLSCGPLAADPRHLDITIECGFAGAGGEATTVRRFEMS